MRPSEPESPALRPIAPAFGRVTLPPFGPIRYGGPKPGAAAVIDDEAPSWAAIEEPPLDEVAASTTELAAPEPEPEPVLPEPEPEPEPEPLPIEALAAPAPEEEPVEAELLLPPVAEREAPAWLDATPATGTPTVDEHSWSRRPVLPLTGPNDPTPIVNQTIERTTEPHRMTPMRVTPLRPAAIPAPSAPAADGSARAIAAALELIAARVRRGDLVVSGSMPTNDDPPALAAALAATLAALLGVKP